MALAGTAIAGPDPVTRAVTKSKVKDIAKRQINKLAPDLDVNSAKTADNATNAANANTATTAKNTFGGEANNSGNLVSATLPGTTVSKAGNTYTWTFPRNVVDCIPVASGIFSDGFVALQAGTAPNNVDKVIVSYFDATGDHNLIVTCP